MPRLFCVLSCVFATFFSAVASYGQGAIRYVDGDRPSGGDGLTWASAYGGVTSLQQGINAVAAAGGGEVWAKVSATAYSSIQLANGVKVYGGFDGTETVASESDPSANVTIISGADSVGAVLSQSNDSTAVLRGFSIEHGRRIATSNVTDDGGGGVRVESGSPTIAECIVHHNFASVGAGIAVYGGTPVIVSCTFHSNGQRATGNPPPNDTERSLGGGGAYFDGGTPAFHNCLFFANKAYQGAAVFAGRDCTGAQFINCTFADNHAEQYAGAVYDTRARTELHNSIVWNNTSGKAYPNFFTLEQWTVSNSNVQGGVTGLGNIDLDPQFTDAGAEDYSLVMESPSVDSADASLLPLDVADLDWDGLGAVAPNTEPLSLDQARSGRVTCAVDMGVFERGPSPAECCADLDCGGSDVCCDYTCSFGNCCDDSACSPQYTCCDNLCISPTLCCTASDCAGTGPWMCCTNSCVLGNCCTDAECAGASVCCAGTCLPPRFCGGGQQSMQTGP